MADYHEDTALLIDRMCELVERSSFDLKKKEAQEKVLQTYDLFGLPRPKNVVWLDTPFDDKFLESAGSAGSARSAWSAGSAWSARSAWSAWSAWSAGSARSAGSAGSAWSARSAWSAGSARSARSARSTRSWVLEYTALDYDFWYYVFSYEYVRNPDKEYPVNQNDNLYLNYCDLLFEAMQLGAGYRVEWEDTLYLCPTPLVKIDNQNRFHSESEAAIAWENKKFYYLNGENFDHDTWKKISDGTITAEEVLKIEDSDQRSIAMGYLGAQEMLTALKAEFVSKGEKGNELYIVKNFMGTRQTKYGLLMTDASTPRQFFHFIEWRVRNGQDPTKMGYRVRENADHATAWMFRDASNNPMAIEDYMLISAENEG